MSEIASKTKFGNENNKYLRLKRVELGFDIFFELENLWKICYQRSSGRFCVNEFVEKIIALEEEMKVIFGIKIKINMRKEDKIFLKTQNYVGFVKI